MKRLLLAAAAGIALSGCATIVDGGGTQVVMFKSVPDSASITITNRAGVNVHTGTTPVTLTLNRGAGYFKPESYSIRIEKAGFQPRDVSLNSTVNGWYIGNLLIGGLIGFLIVDPITGAMYKLSPDILETSLDAAELKTSFKKEGSMTIVLAENVPVALWKHAQPIQQN
jgi:hypothetical protein